MKSRRNAVADNGLDTRTEVGASVRNTDQVAEVEVVEYFPLYVIMQACKEIVFRVNWRPQS